MDPKADPTTEATGPEERGRIAAAGGQSIVCRSTRRAGREWLDLRVYDPKGAPTEAGVIAPAAKWRELVDLLAEVLEEPPVAPVAKRPRGVKPAPVTPAEAKRRARAQATAARS